MKKEDINNEFISKIEIQVDDTLFYMPGETIKGTILLNPKYQMKLKGQMLNLSLKIMQYEFWQYENKQAEEIKNIYTTKIQEENIKYKLKSDEVNKSVVFQNFSLIEKEEENKKISIPFQIQISTEKILPTFQFENKDYILGIRHLLIVECEEYNSSNYIGLFIGKTCNRLMNLRKEIKESYRVGLDTLEIFVFFDKLSFTFDEGIKLDIRTYSNFHFQKITKVKQSFYRKIEWIGYMKNSLLSKDILDEQKTKLNENEYGFFSKLTMPITPILTTIVGGATGGIAGSIGGIIIGGTGGSLESDDNENSNNTTNTNTNNNNDNTNNNNNISNDNNKSDNTNNESNDNNTISKESNINTNNVDNSNNDINGNPESKINKEVNKIDISSENNDKSDSDPMIKEEIYIDFGNPYPKEIDKSNTSNNNNSEKDNQEKKISIIGGVIGGVVGGVLGTTVGALGGFGVGVAKQIGIVKEILNINDKQYSVHNKYTPNLKKPEYETILIENLKKFVYFKDNKVVGFIKFAYNIVPPVNGYYFKCNYNVKAKVEIAGIILSSNKYLKIDIDLYDSEEYITKMKQIFKNDVNKND